MLYASLVRGRPGYEARFMHVLTYTHIYKQFPLVFEEIKGVFHHSLEQQSRMETE